MKPAENTPQEDLKEFGLALALKSAEASEDRNVPKKEIPHVMIDKNKQPSLFLEYPGDCEAQRSAIQRLFPTGRTLRMHRCKDSGKIFY